MNEKNIIKHIKKYYTEALLHIAWITLRNDDGSITRKLVFGMLEFYPSELKAIALSEQEGRFNGFRIYYQRVMIDDVESVVELYHSIQKTSSIPMFWSSDGSIDKEILEGNKTTDNIILCNTLRGYKIWPNFILSSKESEKRDDDNPCIADIWKTVRTHQLMPDEAEPMTLDAISHENVGIWFDQYAGWNISYYPELVGSVMMVLPNPYYSSMGIRVIPIQDIQDSKTLSKKYNNDLGEDANEIEVKPEQIRIEFTPRHNVSLGVLSVIPFENTYFGIAGGKEYRVTK